MVKFWWRFRSRILIRIATLVRRVLTEVCTVPMLVICVIYGFFKKLQFIHTVNGDESKTAKIIKRHN